MRILADRPFLRRAAELAVDAAQEAIERRRGRAEEPLTAPERQEAVVAAADAMAADPVVVNETNSEPWWKSRVYVGIAVALAGQALAWFGVETGPADEAFLSELVTTIGGLIALIGRSVKAGPIVWWKPWTLLGIGGRA